MHEFPEWLKILFVFLLGLEFGSFANVCIYRWPRNASVVKPRRSFCPWCRSPISWIDNIPVLSFLFLKGSCRTCRSPISWRYPAVEISVAVLWLASYLRFGPVHGWSDAVFMAAVFGLHFVAVVSTMTDIDWRIIPDDATALLAVVGLVASAANPLLGGIWIERIGGSILGIAVGAGVIWIIGWAGELIFRREAMGGGDVKLLGAFGSVLGWQGVLIVLFGAALVGGIVVLAGLSTGRLKRHQYIPFGPFLAFSASLLILVAGMNLKVIDPLGLLVSP